MKHPSIRLIFIFLISLLAQQCQLPGGDSDVKKIYFPDGKTLRQVIEFKKGKKNGYMKEYYDNGVLKAQHFYINDTLNDTSAFYYKDGRLKSFQFYKNKRKHGCWKEYNKEGKLYSEIFFKDGLLDSTSSVYTYRTGKLLTRVRYKDGIKNGLEEKYYANGKPQYKALYDEGRPCLGTEEWYESGRKIDNDFKVTVIEKNELLLNNHFSYIFQVEGFQEKDRAYTVTPVTKNKSVNGFILLNKTKNGFVLDYTLSKGGYVMDKVYVGIFRTTAFNNTYIKIIPLNVAINHY